MTTSRRQISSNGSQISYISQYTQSTNATTTENGDPTISQRSQNSEFSQISTTSTIGGDSIIGASSLETRPLVSKEKTKISSIRNSIVKIFKPKQTELPEIPEPPTFEPGEEDTSKSNKKKNKKKSRAQ